MMFLIHAAFALGLLSLTAGSALYIWAARNPGAGSSLGRIVGFIVMVVSVLSLVCSFYLGVMVWKEIYYLHMAQAQQVQAPSAAMKQDTKTVNSSKEHSNRR